MCVLGGHLILFHLVRNCGPKNFCHQPSRVVNGAVTNTCSGFSWGRECVGSENTWVASSSTPSALVFRSVWKLRDLGRGWGWGEGFQPPLESASVQFFFVFTENRNDHILTLSFGFKRLMPILDPLSTLAFFYMKQPGTLSSWDAYRTPAFPSCNLFLTASLFLSLAGVPLGNQHQVVYGLTLNGQGQALTQSPDAR